MSQEKTIAEGLKRFELDAHKDDEDGRLARHCEILARFHLMGKGEPHPLAIEYVVKAIIDAGRIMGAAQLARRQAASKAKEEAAIAAFIERNRKPGASN